jgi:glycolate oxidase
VAREHGLTISNIFHAGDGNLHPIILFNARVPGEKEKARHAGEKILKWCIGCGGSITGEHGVGMEKNEYMPLLFSEATLEMIGQIKLLFDPQGRLNPGKMLPTGRGCMRNPPARPAAGKRGVLGRVDLPRPFPSLRTVCRSFIPWARTIPAESYLLRRTASC